MSVPPIEIQFEHLQAGSKAWRYVLSNRNRDIYPLVNVYITRENHHFLWVNQLFLWPFSSSQTVSLPEGKRNPDLPKHFFLRLNLESARWRPHWTSWKRRFACSEHRASRCEIAGKIPNWKIAVKIAVISVIYDLYWILLYPHDGWLWTLWILIFVGYTWSTPL